MSFRTLMLESHPWLLLGIVLLLSGCFGGEPAPFDPDEVALQAFETYDTDSDGLLSAKELKAVPSLLKSLDKIDVDGDGAISTSELSVVFFKLAGGGIDGELQ